MIRQKEYCPVTVDEDVEEDTEDEGDDDNVRDDEGEEETDAVADAVAEVDANPHAITEPFIALYGCTVNWPKGPKHAPVTH